MTITQSRFIDNWGFTLNEEMRYTQMIHTHNTANSSLIQICDTAKNFYKIAKGRIQR